VKRIALVTGDTAGHTYPALAVAEALRVDAPGVDIVFLGTRGSVAASLVERGGYRFVPVPGSPIRRASLLGLVRAALNSLHAITIARRLLAEERTQVVMGFGSFSTGGVILAARSLGLPTIILEANVEFGLANRWLRPWVTRVCLGLGPSIAPVTGVPVRGSIIQARPSDAMCHSGYLRVLVVSGSRGADFFVSRLPRIFHQLIQRGIRVTVRQQAPSPSTLREQYATLAIDAIVDPFIDDMAAAYAAADVVIARAGANTIAELAVVGLPALLVPLGDASANHQAANADLWQRAGAGLSVRESTWSDDNVVSWLSSMATDTEAWRSHARAARDLARPDAAHDMAAECLRLAASHQ
jgi:UDP-N-acetylglucosamine--N-acetylmuramyl-(pentapeptide) pyrophosphoryl-undecaprenol N-acetylglucosamine transferase